ncbi:MAG: hypothetical protein GY875_03415 [Gammaproteobacteria bacterium]|nr:hypothetical protein [Gammaproteobacteria bacterium]
MALGAGDASHVEVTDVEFLGGDYGIDAYRLAIVRLREGISVDGFNRGGLNVFMGAHIRTDEDITVTGIIGVSTENSTPAINASANGTVQIRNGGTFTAGSNPQTQDLSPDDIYPAAVWASDNSTIRVHGGDNPAVFNGAVEVGYSAMVRMTGDTTIHGVIGVYHSGVMHLTDVVQDTDTIWVGDGGFLRVESGNLSPVSLYDSAMEAYRSGRIRVNNTTINLGGKTLYVGGFSVLNLRGDTTLGDDGIDCRTGNNLNIREGVIHGPVSCWDD